MTNFSKKITQLDLTPILVRLKREYGLSEVECEKAEGAYREFLQCCLDDTGSVPSQLADIVWHYHILDTKKYAADCHTLFGKFMHHHPQDTDESTKKVKLMREAWANNFNGTVATCNRSATCNR